MGQKINLFDLRHTQFMSTRERTLSQLQSVRPVSHGLYKQRIEFHKASDGSSQIKEGGGADVSESGDGRGVASFYKSLVSTTDDDDLGSDTDDLEWCSTCQSQIIDRDRHQLSTVHVSATHHSEAPARPLIFGPHHSGYKYLIRHGWSPLSKRGLGVKGREGSRDPISVHKKDDRSGIGAQPAIPTAKPKAKVQKTMTAKESRSHYLKVQQKRKKIAFELLN